MQQMTKVLVTAQIHQVAKMASGSGLLVAKKQKNISLMDGYGDFTTWFSMGKCFEVKSSSLLLWTYMFFNRSSSSHIKLGKLV